MNAARWLLFAALTWMVGCVTFRWVLSGPSVGRADSRGARQLLEAQLAGLGLIGGVVGLAGLVGIGVGQLLQFRDPYSPILDEARLLLRTNWGTAWKAGLVGCTLTAIGFRVASRPRILDRAPMAWLFPTVVAGALSFFPSFTGHAIGSSRLTWLAVALDGAHVIAAGSWIGTLGVMVVLHLRTRSGAPPVRSLLSAAVPRFSKVALASAATLAVSGLFASWLHLPSAGSLLSSAYGRLLLAKVVVVLIVAALGRANWRSWMRRVRAGEEPELSLRSAVPELILAQIVLVVTAVFVGTAPPTTP
ncbi:MAG: hypothetical protein EXR92_06105 [Gemmatimonadetes bacterium]|nr:hypothetical protein [Gemmatimonadota bacterium]